MFPYWFLFTVFAAGAMQYARTAPIGRHVGPLIGFAAIIPILMIGLRFRVGADWMPYTEIFSEIRYYSFGQTLSMDDPGYHVVNWLAHQLNFDLWMVNLVCAALFCWGLMIFVRHQTHPWLAMVVAIPYLVVVVAMGYSRQAVAIGMIMAALVAWDKGNLVRFVLYVVIGATFHKTAIIAFPLIALSSTRNRIVTGVVVVAFGFFLYRWLLEDQVGRLMEVYLEQEYSSEGAAIRVAMNLVPAAIFLLTQKRYNLTESQLRLWRYFALATLGTLVLLFVLPSSTAVDRIALYLIPLQLFVFSRLPEVFSVGGKPNRQVTVLVIAYSALIQFVWLNYANHAEYWVPYSFWPTDRA